MYASFEANGAPSLNDWQYTQLGNSSYVTFSHDVPSGGGSWSLSLQCDTVYNSGVTNCFHFNNSNDNDVYVLSYWAKCVGFSQGTVQFAMYGPMPADGIGPQRFITNTDWQYNSLTIITPFKADSVEINFFSSTSLIRIHQPDNNPGHLDPGYYPQIPDIGYLLIDGVKLVQTQ